MASAAVEKSSFKVLKVNKREPLKKCVERHKCAFAKGKAFYELAKGEVIQDYKKIVVMRKSDGAFITGEAVRDVLEIPEKMIKKWQPDLEKIPDFKVFIQSTSYNRVVTAGTEVLYMTGDSIVEVDGTASTIEETAPKKGPTPKKPTRATRASARKRTSDKEEEEEETLPTPSPPAKKKAKADVPPAKPASSASTPKPSDPGPGNRKVEIVFSFDTTGSMYACLAEVRRKVQETITRLQNDIPGIRIAVIAHGDYCDRNSTYVTEKIDFSTDTRQLCNFVRNVGSTGGGDADECYELVLKSKSVYSVC